MEENDGEVNKLEFMFTNDSVEPIQISYSVIKSITKNFCQVIGHGGFGIVYLGALRNDVMVAVKELRVSQDFSDTQFLKEIKCLKRVKHKNVVRFLGYCAYTDGVVLKVEGEDRLVDVPKRFLCFEYAPNGSLHDYLQENNCGYEWSIHYKILKGICQGLHYLHQQRITHLDLKPENVLLGAQMEPKITDFGLSRCNDGTQSTIFTKHLLGTPGYIPPELIDEGKISFKSDIYSLGIIMIRLLTRSTKDIPENWCESLNVDCQQMGACIEIAQICADKDPYKRPTIYEIICMLTEKETAIQKVPPVSIIEPRNDPNSRLCQDVKRFLAGHPETWEYHRGPEKWPVVRPKWKLAFRSPPKLPIITDEIIKDANGNPLEVILMDASTGEPSATPDVLQIELVPLLGNFPRDCWDADDFQRGIVEDLEGKGPLMAGECILVMWDGLATVKDLMFTDDSRMCCCMFRIGVRVIPGSYHGPRVLEAMTEAFMVRDRRGDDLHYKKHNTWQLAFQSQPRLPIYVGHKIRDVIGNPLEVILVDTETGSPSALPMLGLEIELVPVFGEFPSDNCKNWSADEFVNAVLNPQDEDAPVLSGDVSLTMKLDDGRVTVSELQFTVGSSYSVRIGACVVSAGYNSLGRIPEAMTKAFVVQDRLTEMNTKRFPPGLSDEVWRLQMIPWGGVFQKRLTQNKVRNVQDFLRMLTLQPDKLRAIMGDGMDDSAWEIITDHAWSCVIPVDKVYVYSAAATTIYVNSVFNLVKVEFSGVECPWQQLDEAQEKLVRQTFHEAYEHRDNLQEVQQTCKLAFKSQPWLPIHAGSLIKEATGKPLEIILVDAKTGSLLALPMELHIQLVPLLGDFSPYDGKEDWSAEEFRTAIVKSRQENVPLLKGDDDCLVMICGRVTVNGLHFTDDSSWVRCRKFRIGACVVPGGNYNGGIRILEAMTEAFVVGNLNRKHYPPVLDDPVWRLEMIDKDGPVHRMLMSNNIDTVQMFLGMLNVKPNELRAIVGNGMTDRMWDMTTNHAMDCDPGDKVYAYSGANGTIYMNSVFGLVFKIEIDVVECPLQQLDEYHTELILEAYEHRHNFQELQQMWRLAFKSQPSLPIHTGSRITDSTGNPLEIILVDANTGSPSELGMELRIQLVPLLGDFPPYDGKEDWSAEEFQTAIVKPRQENVPLLKSYDNNVIMMRYGHVTVNNILRFTDDSSWVPCRKFRIGACVVPRPGYENVAFRILEAITVAFVVEDLNHKYYPPFVRDPLWRLEMIKKKKDGAIHRKPMSNNYDTNWV